MRKRRRASPGVIVVVLAAVVASALVDIDASSAAKQATTAPALVTIDGPWSDGGVRVGAEAAVVVRVLAGSPLRSIELADGPTSIARIRVRGRRAARAFTWVPTVDGERPLVARVQDSAGRAAQSIPVWTTVAPVTAHPASTSDRSGPVAFKVAQTSVPAVSVDPGSCLATISASSPVATTVYAATTGSGGFLPVGKLAGSGDSVVVPSGAGTMAIFGAPSGGGVGSSIVLATAPEQCATKYWTGDAWIAGGVLHTAVPADAAYLYLSVDAGPWTRVPATDQTFVPAGPTPTTFDFAGVLPAVDGAKVEMEVWGRSGGAAQLLGTGVFTVPTAAAGDEKPGAKLADLVLANAVRADLDWVVQGAGAKTAQGGTAGTEVLARYGTLKPYTWKPTAVSQQPGSNTSIKIQADDGRRRFKWGAKLSDVDGGTWQVSTLPPPSGPDLSFPGLRAFGPVPGTGGTFEIDFKQVLLGSGLTKAPDAANLSYDQLVAAGALGGSSGNTKTLAKPTQAGPAPSKDEPPTLWVRIVPTKGGQPVDAASNVVTFTVEWHNVAKIIAAVVSTFHDVFTATATITPPSLPNPTYGRCVRVVANPFLNNPSELGGSNPPPFGFSNSNYKPAPIGSTHCPAYTPPEEDWWDYFVSFVEGVAEFYNVVATFVNDLKTNIIAKFASYSGCSGLLGAKFCEGVITTAVDVFLTANGIPPTVPTTPDLKADLEDQLAQLASEQVAQLCPKGSESACEEQAKVVAKELIAKVEKQVSSAAYEHAQSGDYTLYLNPAITVAPEPAGQLIPAVITVELTKQPPPYKTKVPSSCSFSAYSTAEQPSYSWYGRKSIKGPIEHQTGKITGNPFAPMTKSVPVGEMQPGEKATAVLSVGPLQEVWAPGKSPLYGWWGQKPDTGAFFLDGGQVTIGWKGCGGGTSQTFPQSGGPGDTKPAEIVGP